MNTRQNTILYIIFTALFWYFIGQYPITYEDNQSIDAFTREGNIYFTILLPLIFLGILNFLFFI